MGYEVNSVMNIKDKNGNNNTIYPVTKKENVIGLLESLNELSESISSASSAVSALAGTVAGKVDKVAGKGLSTNDFTDKYKANLDSLDTALDAKADASDLTATQNQLNSLNDEISALSTTVAGKASTSDVTSLATTVGGKADTTYVNTELAKKVNKETGKGLSTNDYTTAEKNKLAGIAEGANKTTVDSALSSTSTNPVQNKAVNTALSSKLETSTFNSYKTSNDTAVGNKADKTYVDNELAKKADLSALTSKADASTVSALSETVATKADSSTVSAISDRVSATETEQETLSARMDTFTKLSEGSTTGDAELADGRVGADGKTYDNIGGAIRGQVTDLKSDLNELGTNKKIIVNFPSSLSGTKYSFTTDVYLTAGTKCKIKNNYTGRYTVFIDGYTGVSTDIAAGAEGIFIPENSGYLRVYTSYAVAGGMANLTIYGDIENLKYDWNSSKGDFETLALRLASMDSEILKAVSGHPDVFYNSSTVDGYENFNALPFNKVFVYTSSIPDLLNTPTGSFFNGTIITFSLTQSKTYGVQIAITQNTGEMYYRYVRTDSGGEWYKVKRDNRESPAPSGDSETVYYVGYSTTGDNYYDSFTACIRALKNDTTKKVIYIKGGTYDIYSEIGGADFLATLTGSENWCDVSDIVPPNTRIVGKGNVTLEMKLPSTVSNNVAKLLSPINVRGTCEIENIKIIAQNCRYCIHDETSGDTQFSGAIKTYRNVVCEKLIGDGLGYPQSYAAGFDDDMSFMFDNCTFKSYGEAWSAHNRSSLINHSSHITMNNCIFTSSNTSSRAVRFGNMNKVKEKIEVMICNSFLSSDVLVRDEYTTDGLINGFAVTMVGCGSKTCEVTTVNNDYAPSVYQIT